MTRLLLADESRYPLQMIVYRLLLVFDYAVAAILGLAFLLWLGGTNVVFPGVIAWIVGLGFIAALIGFGAESRRRGDLWAANICLATVAIPTMLFLGAVAGFFWLISHI